MERVGAWLFRWRSYVPLALLPLVGAAFVGFRYPRGSWALHEGWEVGCLAVSLLGLAVRALTVGHAPAGTSGRNTAEGQVADVLNTTGVYALVRHPLYLGNYLMWLGVVLLPRSGWLVLTVSLAYWGYYERIMLAEEVFLRARFGAAFERWAAATPAVLPRLGRLRRDWRSPTLPFSARTVLRREYSGVLAVALLFAAADVAGNAAAAGRAVLDPLGYAVLGAGLATYLALRTLKRRTRMLHVDGR